MTRLITICLLAVFFIATWGCVPNTQSPDQSQETPTGTINALVEETVPDAVLPESSQDAHIDELIGTIKAMLDRNRLDILWRLPESERDRAVAGLAQHGDVAVVEIERQLVDGEADLDYGWGHNVVRVLEAINSKHSRTLLRRIALGEFGEGNNVLWAARRLIACDRSEGLNLLTATNPEVLDIGLGTIWGQPIDENLMVLLRNNFDMSPGRVASIMAEGTSGELAKEAVEFIVKAMNAAPDFQNFDAIVPDRHGIETTQGERYYQGYRNMLVSVRAEDTVIHYLTATLQGRAKDVAILALAQRGDKSVRDEVVRLTQDAEAGLFRAWAASALGEIGTQDDLPLLRTLVDNDHLVRMGSASLLPPRPSRSDQSSPLPPPPPGARGPTYPVREAAKDAIRMIEARANKGESTE